MLLWYIVVKIRNLCFMDTDMWSFFMVQITENHQVQQKSSL